MRVHVGKYPHTFYIGVRPPGSIVWTAGESGEPGPTPWRVLSDGTLERVAVAEALQIGLAEEDDAG